MANSIQVKQANVPDPDPVPTPPAPVLSGGQWVLFTLGKLFIQSIPIYLTLALSGVGAYVSFRNSQSVGNIDERVNHAIQRQQYTTEQLDSIGAKVDKGMKEPKKVGPFGE